MKREQHHPSSAAAHAREVASGELIRVRKKRSTHRMLKRVLLGVLIAVVVLVGGAAAYSAWYVNSLGSNMAMDPEEEQQLDQVIDTTKDTAQEPYYMLIIGSDKWEPYGERSDAMVLTRIDPTNHQVTMVSIPRDTPYMLDGRKVKINQAFAEKGSAGAVEAVQKLTGVSISSYVEIEFPGLADFVDSIGGVYVDVPYAIDYQVYTMDQDVVHIDAGLQRLNGTQCVALARMRTAYGPDQEAVRQSNIRAMVLALMNQVLDAPPAEIPGLVQRLSQCVSTNVNIQDMISLATGFARDGNTKVYTCTGPYKGDIDPETGLWLCYEDPQGWATLMAAVDAGDDPRTAATTVLGK